MADISHQISLTVCECVCVWWGGRGVFVCAATCASTSAQASMPWGGVQKYSECVPRSARVRATATRPVPADRGAVCCSALRAEGNRVVKSGTSGLSDSVSSGDEWKGCGPFMNCMLNMDGEQVSVCVCGTSISPIRPLFVFLLLAIGHLKPLCHSKCPKNNWWLLPLLPSSVSLFKNRNVQIHIII